MAKLIAKAQPKQAKPEADDSLPRYELTEEAYIGDSLYGAGDVIEFEGVPGPHMIPLNDAAKAKAEEYSESMIARDPILALTLVK